MHLGWMLSFDLQSSDSESLEWRMEKSQASECREAFQSRHDDRQDEHAWCGHQNPAEDDLRNSFGGRKATPSNGLAAGILDFDPLDELVLTHQRNVDAIRCGDCRKWHVSLRMN